jgi:hypothetical protein
MAVLGVLWPPSPPKVRARYAGRAQRLKGQPAGPASGRRRSRCLELASATAVLAPAAVAAAGTMPAAIAPTQIQPPAPANPCSQQLSYSHERLPFLLLLRSSP